jgi:NADPH:quinone reductase-like Zn-dependent oxidoreductase
MSQQALILESKQGPFALSTRPIHAPGKGELLVKVRAVGLNPADWKIQAYGILTESFPAVLGIDIAGQIEGAGEGVVKFSKGDRVYVSPWSSLQPLLNSIYIVPGVVSRQRLGRVPAVCTDTCCTAAARKPHERTKILHLPSNITYSQATLLRASP